MDFFDIADHHSNNPEFNLKPYRSYNFDSWVCRITKDIREFGGGLKFPLFTTTFEMHFAISLTSAGIVPFSVDEEKELKEGVLHGLSDFGINVVDEI